MLQAWSEQMRGQSINPFLNIRSYSSFLSEASQEIVQFMLQAWSEQMRGQSINPFLNIRSSCRELIPDQQFKYRRSEAHGDFLRLSLHRPVSSWGRHGARDLELRHGLVQPSRLHLCSWAGNGALRSLRAARSRRSEYKGG